MRYDRSEYACVIENEREFDGWEILEIEDWKPNVKRVHMRRSFNGGMEFRMVFSDDKYTKRIENANSTLSIS